MAVRVVCDFCRCVMHLSEELRGRKIKCKGCGGVLAVSDDRPSVEEGFTDRRRQPPVANPPPRRRPAEARDDDNDDRRAPRRRRQRASSGSMTALWVAGGTGAALLLVLVVLILALAGGGDNPAQVAVVQNDAAQAGGPQLEQAQPAALNPANPAPPAPPQADVAPAPLPPLVDQPPAGAVLNGEQIYNRMLRSTVWIVASHKIARHEIENDNGHRALQFPQPPIPPRPQMPQIPRPQMPQVPRPQVPRPFGPVGPRMPFGPQPFNPGQNPGAPNPGIPNPGMPQMPQMPLPQNPADLLPNPNQQSTLTGTVWNGSETLAGYGKLTFQFVTNTVAVMIDARETMRGTYRQNGNSVTITFGGGVIYNGTINGDNMAGNAHNGRDNWTWNVAKSAGGNVPTNPGPGGPGIVAKSAGSGSLIDRKHRLIVTNVHVVGTSDTVQVYFPEFDDKGELIVHSDNYKRKPGLTGRVVLREPRADIAFVQLQRLPENSMPLPVATAKAKVASQVHSVGNPGASKGLWIYSPGKVRQVFQDTWKIFDDIENRMCEYNAMKLETDSAINPGDSGGPLVNDRCTLVGVAHGHSLAANNISIFIEASEVRTLLERYYAKFGEKWTPEAAP